MEVAIRQIGNSKGVVLPKPLLAQAGLQDQSVAEIRVEAGVIILRRASKPVRAGWSDAWGLYLRDRTGSISGQTSSRFPITQCLSTIYSGLILSYLLYCVKHVEMIVVEKPK